MVWYYKFLTFPTSISFLKEPNSATDLKSSDKAFHALAEMQEVDLRP